MDIDVRTLFFVHALVSVALTALMVIFWRAHRRMPGLGPWTLGSALLGALILGGALPGWNMMLGGIALNVPHTVGLTTLWAAAILTLLTGWDYLRVGLKHMD